MKNDIFVSLSSDVLDAVTGAGQGAPRLALGKKGYKYYLKHTSEAARNARSSRSRRTSLHAIAGRLHEVMADRNARRIAQRRGIEQDVAGVDAHRLRASRARQSS